MKRSKNYRKLLHILRSKISLLINIKQELIAKYNWDKYARPSQKIPPGNWRVWLILAGRGFGKTRTGAETIKKFVSTNAIKRIALIGQSETEVRDVMIEGSSGLLAVYPDKERPVFEPSKRRLTWSNGSIATIFSAENYEQLRGPQFDFAWIDELAKFNNDKAVWDQLNFSLRLGKCPRAIITTTPRPNKLLQELLEAEKSGDVYVTRGSTFDNQENLSPQFIAYLKNKYSGTNLGQQEIEGKILNDNTGALWSRTLINQAQVINKEIPELSRIIIAIDPAVTSGVKSDETGIIVAGKDNGDTVYVLKDISGRYGPAEWARKAIHEYHNYNADCIVAENNQGGDLVESIIRSIDHSIPFKGVYASRGKVLRAEPVLCLYQRNKVKHLSNGDLAILEQQMIDYVPGKTAKSPDRLDALVWAVTELLLPKTVKNIPAIFSIE